MAGKGDSYRSVNRTVYNQNYDDIFVTPKRRELFEELTESEDLSVEEMALIGALSRKLAHLSFSTEYTAIGNTHFITVKAEKSKMAYRYGPDLVKVIREILEDLPS